MSTATVKPTTVRIEEGLKEQATEFLDSVGLSLNSYLNLAVRQLVNQRKIPFEIEAPQDPFYSKTNLEHIRESDRQIKEGKVVVKTMEELEAMAGE